MRSKRRKNRASWQRKKNAKEKEKKRAGGMNGYQSQNRLMPIVAEIGKVR